jgi:hypothetical protein
MRWIRSARLGVVVGLSLVWTAALTGLTCAEGPASRPPAAKAVVPGAGAASDHVREVQRALVAAGYDPGPIDGIMGPRTKSAVRKYIAVPPPQVPASADQVLAPFRANERSEGQ